MICKSCSFQTPRLLVKEWHSLTPHDWTAPDLADVVAEILTENVTRSLPPGWQGAYTRSRAVQWIEERDAEGTTLIVVARATGSAVGLMILSEAAPTDSAGVEIRLGYLLSEAAWGRGLASELVRGFVDWCRGHQVASVVGGVARENVASRRVLEKNGFICDPSGQSGSPEEDLFRLALKP